MLNTPFSPWPSFTAEESDAVQRVLMSNKVNYWTGTECREFEKEFAQWAGVGYAVALANGTLALDVALKALNIGPGDEVVVTPRTFIASISTVVNAGATPVFADVDPDSGNLSAQTIARVLTPRTKAVICVHLAGWPCDMEPIMALADRQGFKVIEDCAQAHGARYRGRSVGSIGHIGAWSFCQDKIMTTGGEGGMVTTNDESLIRAQASAWLPMAARELRHQLAHAGNAGRHRPYPIASYARLDCTTHQACASDLGGMSPARRRARPRLSRRQRARALQMLCLCRAEATG
jgi:dTDP-4-amino-4,6-dideoxygalactose transaminase